MMTDLKPCPFCGCTATLNFTNDNHHSPWVRCDGAIQTNRTKSCFACQYPWNFKTKEAAIEAWNRRAQPENEPLTLEELIQRCTPKAAELLKRGLFGAVKVCAVDETIQKTNADRIRGMSDEELAEYIFDLGNGSEYCYGHCAYQDGCATKGLDHDTCIKGVIDWLKQPVKEGCHEVS